MNFKRKLMWLTKGWNPYLLVIASSLALWATLHFPSLWIRGVGLCLFIAAAQLLVETMPGGALDPELNDRKSREKRKENE